MNASVVPTFRRSGFRRIAQPFRPPWGVGTPGTRYVLRTDSRRQPSHHRSCLDPIHASTPTTTTTTTTTRRRWSSRSRGTTRVRPSLASTDGSWYQSGLMGSLKEIHPDHLDRETGRSRRLGRGSSRCPFGIPGSCVGPSASFQQREKEEEEEEELKKSIKVGRPQAKKNKKSNHASTTWTERRSQSVCSTDGSVFSSPLGNSSGRQRVG